MAEIMWTEEAERWLILSLSGEIRSYLPNYISMLVDEYEFL